MKNKILQIMYKLSKGEIKYNLASKQVLDLFDDNQQQRELLIAFATYMDKLDGFAPMPLNEQKVDDFLKSN